MLSFTLDTNCVIDVDEHRPGEPSVRSLADAHADGAADVAVVAIMASEKQRGGGTLDNFGIFKQRLDLLRLGQLGLCLPLCYFDISYWDHCLWSGPVEKELDLRIHQILFTDIKPDYREFCDEKGLPSSPVIWDKTRHIWRNAKCDVQAIWSHVNARRDVFVSNDKNFHDHAAELVALGAGRIETPATGAALR